MINFVKNAVSVRLLTIVVILSVMNVRAGAQILMTGNIETHVDSLIHAMPDGSAGEQDLYQPPSGLDLATWGNTIAKIMQVGYAAANDSASRIQYRIVQFTDNTSTPSKTYYILEKTAAGSHYWGVFVYNPAPKRGKLFIQSPHPLYDSNTGQQGIAIMKNNGARAWYVSGTHRCNSTTNTACDGTTDVCGGDYKISDQAHVANGPLQCATEIVSANIAQLIIIQNHGFGKGTGDQRRSDDGEHHLVRHEDVLGYVAAPER